MTLWEQYAAYQDSRKIYLAELETLAPDDDVEVLRVSTAPIDPLMTDYPYLPILASGAMPAYSTSIQEVLQGQSQDGFGGLALTIIGGRIDERIATHRWAGRPVTIKMGFAGLPVADYRVLFTGRQQRAEYDDATLNIPIMSDKLAVTRRRRATGTYSGLLPSLVSTLLGLAGITNIDTAAWNTWAAENNFQASYTSANTSIGELLDKLIGPLACYWRFKRDGQFTIGTFKVPNPAATPDLVIDTAIQGVGKTSAVKVKRLDRYWKVRVQYNPSTKLIVSQEDSSIKTDDPLALDGGPIETFLSNITNANTVLARWWALRSPQRYLLTITTKVRPLALELHNQIALTHHRHGFNATPVRVVSLNEDYNSNQVTIGGWL